MKAKIIVFTVLFFTCFSALQAQVRVVLPFAGSGTVGGSPIFLGDGGPATAATLAGPVDVAIYNKCVYIADAGNNAVRKINTAGIITTIAGNGTPGYSGDGGPATAALLFSPHGVTFDRNGNIYICDAGNQVIRKIDTAGIINTYAGNGYTSPSGGGYNGDGIPATDGEFNNPFHITLDTAGNLYIADVTNSRIRKVSASGMLTTVAGDGTFGISGDGGPATDAALKLPKGVAADRLSNIYIADQNYAGLRKVNASGIISTIAGNGVSGDSGDGGPATAAQLHTPLSIACDYTGNIFFSDLANHIRKIDTAGIITAVAGVIGTGGYSGDGGPAILAEFREPGGIAVDSLGIIYIADATNNRVRILDYAPAFITGHTQNISACLDSISITIDTALAVIDSDKRQTETWSLVSAPAHGSAAVAYTTVSTGAALMPSGLTYTPVAGYTGADTFMVRVTDGHVSDTTAIYVSIDTCAPAASQAVNTPGDALNIYPNPSDGTFTVTLASAINENGTLIITDLPGRKIKEQAIRTNIPVTIATGLPTGIYLLNALTAHGNWYKQVIIK